MGYLVIKNGNTRKSYTCTNTCNKPRVKVSDSYIPLTNNVKNGMKCKITNKNIAEYNSYTYTGNQGTITTGTTYLTRASTSNTVYGTKIYYDNVWSTVSIYSLTTAPKYHTMVSIKNTKSNNSYTITVYTSFSQTYYNAYRGLEMTTTTYNMYYNYINNPITFTSSEYTYRPGYAMSETITRVTVSTTRTVSYGSGGEGYAYEGKATVSVLAMREVATTLTSTTGTTYQTRASTYNTLYGTKTTNKTLTSSSWG